MATMINNITAYMYRTNIIINIIKRVLKEHNDRQILLLSDRKNHLKDVEKIVKKNDVNETALKKNGAKKYVKKTAVNENVKHKRTRKTNT